MTRKVARWDEDINGLLMADNVVADLASRRIGSIEKRMEKVARQRTTEVFRRSTCPGSHQKYLA